MAATPPGAEATILTTAGRVIAGLGTESVLETGIRLHHTYGLPVIPGSALKGLAAHYCYEVWGQHALGDAAPPASKPFRRPTKGEDEVYKQFLQGDPKANPAANYFRLLFGNTDDSGVIVFHDAWLTPDSADPLVLDVMTPHHPDWQDGSAPPTDFDSPVPVAFVSATGSFRVMVSWNGPAGGEQPQKWTKLTMALLKEALAEWGIGGKTSSGYGRLLDTATAPKPKPKPKPKQGPGHPPPPPTGKRPSGTKVRVKLIAVRPKGGFDIQEPGRKPGTLTLGKPPADAAIDKEFDVLVADDQPDKPQYKWY